MFGEQSTEFRPYGLDLDFQAQSVDLNTVELEVNLSLTALDYGVAINGVPGLTNRDIHTKRQFRLGESVVLARIERGEAGSNDSGLPGVTTKNERVEEERELWVLFDLVERRWCCRKARQTRQWWDPVARWECMNESVSTSRSDTETGSVFIR